MSDLESNQNYQPMTLGQWMLTTFLAQLPRVQFLNLFVQ